MMTHRLSGILEDERAVRMRERDDLRERRTNPEDVALRGDGDEFHIPLAQELLQLIELQLTVIVTVDPENLDPLSFLQLQPRHDVAVVFENGEDHAIAFFEQTSA